MFIFVLVVCLVLYMIFKGLHTKDLYTSAQPPPPGDTRVSTNIVYPSGTQVPYGIQPVLGVDYTTQNIYTGPLMCRRNHRGHCDGH